MYVSHLLPITWTQGNTNSAGGAGAATVSGGRRARTLHTGARLPTRRAKRNLTLPHVKQRTGMIIARGPAPLPRGRRSAGAPVPHGAVWAHAALRAPRPGPGPRSALGPPGPLPTLRGWEHGGTNCGSSWTVTLLPVEESV